MDDTYDDLNVSDNWFQSPVKRKMENSFQESPTLIKKIKLHSNSVHADSLGLDSAKIETAVNSTSPLIISGEKDDTQVLEETSVLEISDSGTNEDDIEFETVPQKDILEESTIDCSLTLNTSEIMIISYNEVDKLMPQDDKGHSNLLLAVDPSEIKHASLVKTMVTKMPFVVADKSDTDTSQLTASASAATPERTLKVKKISSIVRDAHIIAGIVTGKSANEIYDLLLDHRDREDRLDFVTLQLVNTLSASNSSTNDSPGVDIFEEVQKVVSAVPSADVNKVYTLLESLPPSADRVDHVIMQMKTTISDREPMLASKLKPVLLRKDSSTVDDPLLKNDPLFQDMRTIAKMFPDKDRNEIYALLEANFRKENRLETVINEILFAGANSRQESQLTQPLDQSDPLSAPGIISLDAVAEDVEKLKTVFPDCDPNYLYEKLEAMKDVSNRTNVLAAEMFDKRSYPKLKDLQDKESTERSVEKAMFLTFTVEEFLQKFPDPVKTFGNIGKELTENYKQHADIALKNEFPMLKCGYIKMVLDKHNGHFYPAYQEISGGILSIPLEKYQQHGRFLRCKRFKKFPMPPSADEYFYHELWFVQNELLVLDYPKKKEEKRQKKLDEARTRGELYECCCCYDDECLFEGLASCPEGHLFCKTCVLRSAEAAFGEMKTKFQCLAGECDQQLALSTLQSVLPANLFSKIVQRMQEEEVQQANIPDLVTCPFCPFATIMPNLDDKVLKCLNPDCLKESCRLCQEPNHIPLRCNEVEKKAATDMRTYIENQISEAVMRKCGKCGKRFVKDMGCNKMTCVCGYTSCYACKAQGIDYNHFTNNTKCAEANPDKIHQHDMKEAAIKAKNQYLLDHPEAADIELKTDIKDMIKSYGKKYKQKLPFVHGHGAHVDEDDVYDEEEASFMSDVSDWDSSDDDDDNGDNDEYDTYEDESGEENG